MGWGIKLDNTKLTKNKDLNTDISFPIKIGTYMVGTYAPSISSMAPTPILILPSNQ